jgi:hypothetical protein
VKQTPLASILTRTSSAFGTGRGTSEISNGLPYSISKAAFIMSGVVKAFLPFFGIPKTQVIIQVKKI